MTTLIDEAEALLDGGGADATTRACWLARAALEDAIGDLLNAAGLDVGEASGAARLACLQVAYEEHADVATRAEYVWSRLSEACHHHAFALAPTYGEAHHLVGLVRQFVAAAFVWGRAR